MSALNSIGWCCLLLSLWAIIQLSVMGFFYRIEAFTLLEDVHPEEYRDANDAIEKTKASFKAVARNCWIAAGMYVVMFLLSIFCIFKARQKSKRDILLSDDELFCNPDLKVKTKAPKEPKPPKASKPSKAPKEKTRMA